MLIKRENGLSSHGCLCCKPLMFTALCFSTALTLFLGRQRYMDDRVTYFGRSADWQSAVARIVNPLKTQGGWYRNVQIYGNPLAFFVI
jgi:hypothetical protein